MFRHLPSAFGKYKKHTFENNEGTGFTLVPEYGACLLKLSFSGQQILDAYTTPEELDFNRWFKNLFLFPFPNRLKKGQYQWEGKTYRFPINDGPTGNALHGFGFNQKMEIVNIKLLEKEAKVDLKFIYNGDIGAYPFPFSFQLGFSLSTNHTFIVEMKFTNTGQNPMPIGWGWHPYFKITEKVEDLELQTPALQMIGIDKCMIPTGKRYDYEEFTQMKKIGVSVLDNCFALKYPAEKAVFQLKSQVGTLQYWQESSPGKYPYVQLFTPPYRKSLAIEPMTCNVDAFNNHDNLICLNPGESTVARFGLEWMKG